MESCKVNPEAEEVNNSDAVINGNPANRTPEGPVSNGKKVPDLTSGIDNYKDGDRDKSSVHPIDALSSDEEWDAPMFERLIKSVKVYIYIYYIQDFDS